MTLGHAGSGGVLECARCTRVWWLKPHCSDYFKTLRRRCSAYKRSGADHPWDPLHSQVAMAMHTTGDLLSEHGSGANTGVGDDDERNGGSMAAGSTDGSFEYIPQEYGGPPGLSEEQRAEFERARQTPLSPIPSQRGDDDLSETTMTMLKMMQRQMEIQMQRMMRMEERDERRKEEEREPKEKMKWRGVKLEIKHFSRVEIFRGEHSKFRDWFFSVNTVIGQLDQKLSGALKTLLEEDNVRKAEDLVPKEDTGCRGSCGTSTPQSYSGSGYNLPAEMRGRCVQHMSANLERWMGLT